MSTQVKNTATDDVMRRAELSRHSFEEFCRFVLGIAPAPHQKRWVEELQRVADRPKGARLMIIAPPGSGKTQLVGVGFMAWMLGRVPMLHYGLLSYSDIVGWARSRAIKALIEHSLPYQLTFPNIRPSRGRWGDSEFIVARRNLADPHPTLRAGGAKSAVVAYRLNGLLIDDPLDQKSAANPLSREKVIKNYDEAISTRLTSDSWEVVIGTKWAEDDFIGTMSKRGGWRVVHIPALSETGDSYWPEHYPNAYLEKIKQDSPVTFAIQYMGDTAGEDAGIIQRIRHYDGTPRRLAQTTDLLIAAGWDTAFKEKERNDYSVGYIGGIDPYGNVFILDRRKGRWGLPQLMNEIVHVEDSWDVYCTWVEDRASGTPAIQKIIAEMPDFNIEPAIYHGGKTSRAHALAPHIHSGQVLFPPESEPWVPDALHFITRFPNAQFDDDIDALFILVDNLMKVKHPAWREMMRRGQKITITT